MGFRESAVSKLLPRSLQRKTSWRGFGTFRPIDSTSNPDTQKGRYCGLTNALRWRRGPGRSRTDDGGFAIRCLSHLATGPDQRMYLTIRDLGVARPAHPPQPGFWFRKSREWFVTETKSAIPVSDVNTNLTKDSGWVKEARPLRAGSGLGSRPNAGKRSHNPGRIPGLTENRSRSSHSAHDSYGNHGYNSQAKAARTPGLHNQSASRRHPEPALRLVGYLVGATGRRRTG